MIRFLASGGKSAPADFKVIKESREEVLRRLSFLEAEAMRARRASLLELELQGLEVALRNTPGKRILVAGWYGADNLGDELMLRAVLEHLPEEALARTAVLLWDNSTYDRMTLDARVHVIHYPATTRELDALVSHFDVVVWGGGAILDDGQFNNDANNFNTGNLFIRINDLMLGRGKQVFCLGLSSNKAMSNSSYLSRLRRIVGAASHFSLRDKNSRDLLVGLDMPAEKLTTCEDLAFSLKLISDIRKKGDAECFTLGFVPLHVEGLLETYANVLTQVVTEAKTFADGRKVKILLIPFLNEGGFDENANGELKRLLEGRIEDCQIELARYELNPSESPIRECNMLISYKYHAALIACCAGIPCLMVSRDEHAHYANKMSHLAELAGVESAQVSSGKFEKEAGACSKAFFDESTSPRIRDNVYAAMSDYMDMICREIAL